MSSRDRNPILDNKFIFLIVIDFLLIADYHVCGCTCINAEKESQRPGDGEEWSLITKSNKKLVGLCLSFFVVIIYQESGIIFFPVKVKREKNLIWISWENGCMLCFCEKYRYV